MSDLHIFINKEKEAIDCYHQYIAGNLSLHQVGVAIDFLGMQHLFDVNLNGELIQVKFPKDMSN